MELYTKDIEKNAISSFVPTEYGFEQQMASDFDLKELQRVLPESYGKDYEWLTRFVTDESRKNFLELKWEEGVNGEWILDDKINEKIKKNIRNFVNLLIGDGAQRVLKFQDGGNLELDLTQAPYFKWYFYISNMFYGRFLHIHFKNMEKSGFSRNGLPPAYKFISVKINNELSFTPLPPFKADTIKSRISNNDTAIAKYEPEILALSLYDDELLNFLSERSLKGSV